MEKPKGADGFDCIDRISELPQVILQQFLYFLTQKEAAQTCVLSKSWHYTWCTRPNIAFLESSFNGTKEEFLSLVNKTLQRYCDQKLCIEEFRLQISTTDSDESVSLLEKWFSLVMIHMCVKGVDLAVLRESPVAYFDLPSVVYESKSIKDLHLYRCKLDERAPDKVLFKQLKKLYLHSVCIVEGTFHNIISSCPLFQTLCLQSCRGVFSSFGNFLTSYNFPSFEYLTLFHCSGFEECQLFIDAPNILKFSFDEEFIPSISFAATSREWKSEISLWFQGLDDVPSWLFNLNKLLRALSQSEF